MQVKKIRIINKLGLHARAAAALVKLATGFHSDVMIRKETQLANAKNIMEILMLAATQHTELVISTDGPDEKDAIQSIIGLIDSKFYELE